MLTDPRTRADIARDLSIVLKLCGSHRQYQIDAETFIGETPSDEAYNLPFVAGVLPS